MSHTIGATRIPTMQVYEENYNKLLRLLPAMRVNDVRLLTVDDDSMELKVEVMEHCAYTTMLRITHYFAYEGGFLPDMTMNVRVYHDARVAEVVSYQTEGRFQPRYEYPNPKMRQPDEKRQLNYFLEDWLNYCLLRGVQFEHKEVDCSDA